MMKSTPQGTRTFGWLLLTMVAAIALPREAHAQMPRDRLLPLPREIERALIYNPSQDFFRQGRERFEQEVRELRDRKLTRLKIQYELPERGRLGCREAPSL
jgi:hypothetical protein